VHTQSVEQARPGVREVAVPHLIRSLAQPQLLALDSVVRPVEEAQLDRRRVLEKMAKLTPSPSHVAPSG